MIFLSTVGIPCVCSASLTMDKLLNYPVAWQELLATLSTTEKWETKTLHLTK